jgi:hypothetical protein
MKIPCAKNCPERNSTCHSSCPRYKEFRAAKDIERAERIKRSELQMAIAEAEYKRYRKTERK